MSTRAAAETRAVLHGIPRFRHPADLALVVLAAVAYEQLFRRRGRRAAAPASLA